MPGSVEDVGFWRRFRIIASLLLPWVFVHRLRMAIRWVRADQLSADGKHEEALRLARSLPAEFRKRRSWRLFEIQQLSVLDWHNETIEKANAFLLDATFWPRPLHPGDEYFTYFAQWLGRRAFQQVADGSPVPSIFAELPVRLDLRTVPQRWRRAFPLRVHPEWTEV